MRKALNRTRKEVVSHFYQPLSGHAAVAEHLKRIGQAPNDLCFWCGSGGRQDITFHQVQKVGSRDSEDVAKNYVRL